MSLGALGGNSYTGDLLYATSVCTILDIGYLPLMWLDRYSHCWRMKFVSPAHLMFEDSEPAKGQHCRHGRGVNSLRSSKPLLCSRQTWEFNIENQSPGNSIASTMNRLRSFLKFYRDIIECFGLELTPFAMRFLEVKFTANLAGVALWNSHCTRLNTVP